MSSAKSSILHSLLLGESSPGVSVNEGSPRLFLHPSPNPRVERLWLVQKDYSLARSEGLVEVVPRVGWRVACVAEALPRTLAFRSPPLGGLLVLPRRGGVLAFVVTPCSLQAGSVRSCILRIPMVQVPSAYLQSLQIPLLHSTRHYVAGGAQVTNSEVTFSPTHTGK